MSRSVKNKLVECVAINMAKECYGDSNKKYEFYVEAELLLKNLFLDVLIEKSKGDPLEYVTFLESMEEIFDLDYYSIYFLENVVFNEINWERCRSLFFLLKKIRKKYIYK